MNRIASTVAASLAIIVASATGASATSILPPCEYEDSINCTGDATTQGNAIGRSFTDVEGTPHYWDEASTDAWALFDMYGAELLPNREVRVEYVGQNRTGYPLTDTTIMVGDNAGNYYLFAF